MSHSNGGYNNGSRRGDNNNNNNNYNRSRSLAPSTPHGDPSTSHKRTADGERAGPAPLASRERSLAPPPRISPDRRSVAPSSRQAFPPRRSSPQPSERGMSGVLTDRVAKLDARTEQLSHRLSDTKDDLAREKKARVADVDSAMSKLRDEIARSASSGGADFTRHQKKVNDYVKQQLDMDFDSTKQYVDKCVDDTAAMSKKKIDKLTGLVDDLDDDVQQLTVAVDALRKQNATLMEQMAAVLARLDSAVPDKRVCTSVATANKGAAAEVPTVAASPALTGENAAAAADDVVSDADDLSSN